MDIYTALGQRKYAEGTAHLSSGSGKQKIFANRKAIRDWYIARQYRKLAYRCCHCPGDIAVVQKIKALSGRPVTQARDVFDLGILFAGGHAPSTPLNKLIPKPSVGQAIDCLMGLTWEDYQGQVVEFLDSEHRTEYGTHSAWTNIQELVLEKLSPYA